MDEIKETIFNLIFLKNYIETEIKKTNDPIKISYLEKLIKKISDSIKTIEKLIQKNIEENKYNIKIEDIEETIEEKCLKDIIIENKFKKIEIEEELKKLKESLKWKTLIMIFIP